MSMPRIVPATIVLLASAMMIGCSEPQRPGNPSVPTTPAYTGPIITTIERESLLEGAGIVDNDAPKEFSQTDSGLKYRILRKTDGKKPASISRVTVNYRGWLDDGTEFDSSYKRGEPTSFPLNGVIKGWTEGLQLVSEGGMIELWIPSELGYGQRGMPGAIPPDATLHFVVELIRVY